MKLLPNIIKALYSTHYPCIYKGRLGKEMRMPLWGVKFSIYLIKSYNIQLASYILFKI